MKVIATEYLKYLEAAFPGKEKIDAVQIIETRRAFMAGAKSMFVLVNDATELSTEEAVKQLSELNKELFEFMLMVQAGVA